MRTGEKVSAALAAAAGICSAGLARSAVREVPGTGVYSVGLKVVRELLKNSESSLQASFGSFQVSALALSFPLQRSWGCFPEVDFVTLQDPGANGGKNGGGCSLLVAPATSMCQSNKQQAVYCGTSSPRPPQACEGFQHREQQPVWGSPRRTHRKVSLHFPCL